VTFSPAEKDLLAEARRASLATIDAHGRARLVPICFVLIDDVMWSPIDEKPKIVADPRALARVRDIQARPAVTVLVDRWSEDWSKLAWLRLVGRAEFVEPGDLPVEIVPALRAKYSQYRRHALESRPMIKITLEHATSWFASTSATDSNAARRTFEDVDPIAVDPDPDDRVVGPLRPRSE
jgi:PPOX class probable F420-dependent enzyme